MQAIRTIVGNIPTNTGMRTNTMADTATSSLQRALRVLLKPFVRLALQRGFKIQETIALLKELFIEVAAEELAAHGQAQNISRLSVLTGLQRKEIKLRAAAEQKDGGGAVSLLNKVIGQWVAHPEYSTSRGQPRKLTSSGAKSEFAHLVRSVSVDLNPYTVLFELERAGAVKHHAGKLELLTRVFAPPADTQKGLEMLGEDVQDLVGAVNANLFNKPEVPHLHLSTMFDNICAENVEEIREWLLQQGTKFHEQARQYLARYDKDANPTLGKKRGRARIALCAFSFSESVEEGEHERKH